VCYPFIPGIFHIPAPDVHAKRSSQPIDRTGHTSLFLHDLRCATSIPPNFSEYSAVDYIYTARYTLAIYPRTTQSALRATPDIYHPSLRSSSPPLSISRPRNRASPRKSLQNGQRERDHRDHHHRPIRGPRPRRLRDLRRPEPHVVLLEAASCR
jgi:hypothetical protein